MTKDADDNEKTGLNSPSERAKQIEGIFPDGFPPDLKGQASGEEEFSDPTVRKRLEGCKNGTCPSEELDTPAP